MNLAVKLGNNLIRDEAKVKKLKATLENSVENRAGVAFLCFFRKNSLEKVFDCAKNSLEKMSGFQKVP